MLAPNQQHHFEHNTQRVDSSVVARADAALEQLLCRLLSATQPLSIAASVDAPSPCKIIAFHHTSRCAKLPESLRQLMRLRSRHVKPRKWSWPVGRFALLHQPMRQELAELPCWSLPLLLEVAAPADFHHALPSFQNRFCSCISKCAKLPESLRRLSMRQAIHQSMRQMLHSLLSESLRCFPPESSRKFCRVGLSRCASCCTHRCLSGDAPNAGGITVLVGFAASADAPIFRIGSAAFQRRIS